MTGASPNPGEIMRLATGYWESATLLAANHLNLFDALAAGPLTAAQVAAGLQRPVRGVAMLLDACAALGLLLKEIQGDESVYRNAPEADAFLVPGRPGYLGDAIRWSADQYRAWGDLAQAVGAGAPVTSPALHLGGDAQETRTFVLGMHNRALSTARGVLPFLDLEGVADLLDVGGGPGTYAVLLTRKYPDLNVTVLDLPGVLAVAAELIAQADAGERVRLQPGDAVKDDYGEALYDGVLFSGVLHQMAPPTIERMLSKAYLALKPGGRVIISDIMLDASKTQPPFAALFSLQMLLTSAEGAVFSLEECTDWLEAAGFSAVQTRRLPPPLPYAAAIGRKE